MPRHLFDALHSHSAAMVGEVARVDEVELAVTRVSSVPNHKSPFTSCAPCDLERFLVSIEDRRRTL